MTLIIISIAGAVVGCLLAAAVEGILMGLGVI
jgi:hypothetical protein